VAQGEPGAWLFVAPNAVPQRWSHRAIPMSLIPLDRDELAEMLIEGSASPVLDDTDLEIVRLVARGITARRTARMIGISERSVHRRLAALRARYEAQSNAELVAELGRRGF
jgi:DNA-binding CsgD family transcriptional regulator